MTTKFLDKIAEREDCRARLLELRRVMRTHTESISKLQTELNEYVRLSQREVTRLVALTTEVASLAHADLAGIVGRKTDEPAATPETPIATS